MIQKSYLRLALYILIGTMPELINWLTLTFDCSPRGALILLAKATLTACITARAYIDNGGDRPIKTTETIVSAPPNLTTETTTTTT